jgi:hypothetical protein
MSQSGLCFSLIEAVPVRYLNKEKLADPLLDRLRDSDKFVVGVRDNQPANSSLANAIDEALLRSSNGKRFLFKVLRDKGFPVEGLHKFGVPRSDNLALEKSNNVPYKESDFFLYQSSLFTLLFFTFFSLFFTLQSKVNQSKVNQSKVNQSKVN